MMTWKKNDSLILGSILTAAVLILALVGFFYTPYDPEAMNLTEKFAGVSIKHFMGCDHFGRDVFSRVLKGMGTTLFISVCVVATGGIIGTLTGLLTGYFGGAADEILMRINDAIFAFPSILLALVFVSLFGAGRNTVILALGIAFIPSFARLMRSEVIKQKNLNYVKSVRLMGASHARILFVHILPNTFSVLFPAVLIGFNNAVLAEAGMSYLGIGVAPPQASLGRMLQEAQGYLFSAPGNVLFPGAVMVCMILGFGLLGDGFKQIYDATD